MSWERPSITIITLVLDHLPAVSLRSSTSEGLTWIQEFGRSPNAILDDLVSESYVVHSVQLLVNFYKTVAGEV